MHFPIFDKSRMRGKNYFHLLTTTGGNKNWEICRRGPTIEELCKLTSMRGVLTGLR